MAGVTEKILICPYFGTLPPWMDLYWENTERLRQHGYNFLLDTDEDAFRDRVRDRLGIEPPPMWGTGKIWDFRPALGFLYADEIDGAAWWGHTDFDCVYGRVEQFVTDAVLDGCDIYTDCAHDYISGPWSLYCNEPAVRELFTMVTGWKNEMEAAAPTGWCETSFTGRARDLARLTVANNHAYTRPELLRRDGDRLLHDGREIAYFHFRHTKEWPL